MSYLVKRLGWTLAQLLIVSFLSFLLFSLAPGDYYSMADLDPRQRKETLEQWRREQGLDQPWPVRYQRWLTSAVKTDFGTSLAYGMPVAQVLGARLGKTLQVAIPALVIGWTLGLLLAAAVARWGPAPIVAATGALVAAGALAPEVIISSLLLWFAVALGMPLTGIWLPICGLVIAIIPVVYLHGAGSLLAARQLAFVRLAEQRGIGQRQLWIQYLMPAAANPLISLLGLSIGGVLGSSLIVEAVTGWPGLGPLLVDSVHARDYPVIQAIVVITCALLAFANLLADLLLYWHDPRIRVGYETAR